MMSKLLTGLLVLGLLGLSLILSSCASFVSGAPTPKSLAQETKVELEKVKETEQTVFQVLDENLKAVKELKEKVQRAEEPSKLLDEIIKRLERITEDFEEMARGEGRIERDLLSRQRALHRLTDNALGEIEKLRAREAELERRLRTITETDPERIEMRRKGYIEAIEYIKNRISIWEKFLQTHQQILGEVSKVDERVGKFLLAIEMSALVFREGLETLKLQRDIQEAQALLSEIPEIERLTQEMVASWDTLNSLIQELLSFSI